MIAEKLKYEIFRSNVASKRKMTDKARVIVMMLMRDFAICVIIIMMTFFFRKLLRDMFITVYRLKQY